MKSFLKINIAFILVLTVNITVAQTCKLESEIPSTTPDSKFVDNNDGTITDSFTGLMWHKCELGISGTNCDTGVKVFRNWQQALDLAKNSSLAGYSNWRLPKIKELRSIVEQRCSNPAINTNFFPNTTSDFFWSASPNSVDDSKVWLFGMFSGNIGSATRDSPRAMRLVRFP